MKKIISLFISVSLLLTMSVNVFASEAALASDAPVTISGTVHELDIDTGIGLPAGNSFKWNGFLGIRLLANRSQDVRVVSGIGGNTTKALKFPNLRGISTDSYKGDYVDIHFTNASTGASVERRAGVWTFSGKFYPQGISGGYLIEMSTSEVKKTMYSYDAQTGKYGNFKFNDGIWYDFEYTIDVNNGQSNYSIKFSNLNEQTGETDVQIRTGSWPGNIKQLRLRPIFAGPYSDGSFYAYDDLKITYSKTKETITSIDPVEHSQKNITFTMSDVPAELKKEHITIENEKGIVPFDENTDITISTETGTISAVMSENFASNTKYKISIAPQGFSFANDVEVASGGEPTAVTPITAEFTTSPLPTDISAPSVSLSGNTVTMGTNIVNTSGQEEKVTLMLVIFDQEGRIKTITPKSVTIPSGAGETPLNVQAAISNGDNAKFFVINGWSGAKAMLPYVEKSWETSYDALTQN